MRLHDRGFTLLEVMAAILIMSLAFAALLEVLGSSVALTHKAAMRTRAMAWGQSMLDSHLAMQRPVPGTRTGRFNATYRWRLDVAPWRPHTANARHQTPVQHGGIRLYSLNLAVMWGTPPREHMVHLATLRAVRMPRTTEASP